jgi:hypothetical protein
MRTMLLVAAVIVTVVGVAGCAPSSNSTSAGRSAPTANGRQPTFSAPPVSKTDQPKLVTNPLDNPSADHKIVYNAGLTSWPIPASVDTSVPITAAKALSLVNAAGRVSDEMQPGKPNIVLRFVSVGYSSKDEGYSRHLAWVLTWDHSKPAPHGPANSTNAPDFSELRCVFVTIVNAHTGKQEDDRQLCRPTS